MATIMQRGCPCRSSMRFAARKGRRCSVAVRAGDDKRGVDWDSEWAKFNTRGGPGSSRGGSNTYTTTSGSGTTSGSSSSSRGRQRVPVDPAAQQMKARLRREESLLLNLWTSPVFQGAGIVAAMVVFLGILISAGPPPVDSRCTLPWC